MLYLPKAPIIRWSLGDLPEYSGTGLHPEQSCRRTGAMCDAALPTGRAEVTASEETDMSVLVSSAAYLRTGASVNRFFQPFDGRRRSLACWQWLRPQAGYGAQRAAGRLTVAVTGYDDGGSQTFAGLRYGD